MGLIAAALNAAGGTLASQWKEYFYCDAIPENVLAVKGQKAAPAGISKKIKKRNYIALTEPGCILWFGLIHQGLSK